jgi:hypothetical protein
VLVIVKSKFIVGDIVEELSWILPTYVESVIEAVPLTKLPYAAVRVKVPAVFAVIPVKLATPETVFVVRVPVTVQVGLKERVILKGPLTVNTVFSAWFQTVTVGENEVIVLVGYISLTRVPVIFSLGWLTVTV